MRQYTDITASSMVTFSTATGRQYCYVSGEHDKIEEWAKKESDADGSHYYLTFNVAIPKTLQDNESVHNLY